MSAPPSEAVQLSGPSPRLEVRYTHSAWRRDRQSSLATFAVPNGKASSRSATKLRWNCSARWGAASRPAAGTVLRALRVGAGASFAVTGAGAVGLSAVMVANVAGANAFMQSCKTLMGFVEGDGVPNVVNPQLIDVHL